MFLNLLWKEWSEQRWRLAFLSVLVCGLTATGLSVRLMPDINVARITCLIGASLAMLVGIGLVPHEREQGTIRLLLFLPIRPRQILLAKLLVALIVTLVPLIASFLVFQIMAGQRESSFAEILQAYLVIMIIAVTLLLWSLAFSIRARSESVAGFAIIAIVAWTFLEVAIIGLIAHDAAQGWGWSLLLQPYAAAAFIDNASQLCRSLVIPAQLFLALVLSLWTLWQFPKTGRKHV